MKYTLLSENPEITLSEVNLENVFDGAEIQFKFSAAEAPDATYTSKIECFNKGLNIFIFKEEDKLELQGNWAKVLEFVELVKNHFGQLSHFTLRNEEKNKEIEIMGNTPAEKIDEKFQ